MKVWDITVAGSREWLTVTGAGAVDLSSDGRLLATEGDDGALVIYDAASGETVRALRGHRAEIVSVDFAPSGSLLASASNDGTARIWDAESGAELRVLRTPDGDGWVEQVWDVAFSQDGRGLATSSWPGSPVSLWDPATGEQLSTFREEPTNAAWPRSVAFSRDGKLVAGEDFNFVYVWDAADGRVLANIAQRTVNALAFGADGSRLVTAADDGSVTVWDPHTGEQLDTLAANLGQVTDLAFSPTGTTIATSASDGTIRLWDSRTLEPLLTLAREAEGKLAFSQDGSRLAYTAADGTVRVVALSVVDLIELARSRLARSWTQDECRIYLHLETCPAVDAGSGRG
jgi:WD40 repeat protein